MPTALQLYPQSFIVTGLTLLKLWRKLTPTPKLGETCILLQKRESSTYYKNLIYRGRKEEGDNNIH